MTIATQQNAAQKPQCPRCGNRDIKTGALGRYNTRAYDIWSDTFGHSRCPECGFRAHSIEFQPKPKAA